MNKSQTSTEEQRNCLLSSTQQIKSDLIEKNKVNSKLKEQVMTNSNDKNNNEANGKYIEDQDWHIDSSEFAKATLNPVRKLIEQMKLEPNPDKKMIALSIGDPTILSEMEKPDVVKQAAIACIEDKLNDSYTPSFGTEKCRTAVAKYYSRPQSNVNYKHQDIVLTHGCSHALDICITVLANRGQNILIPRPGFSIYKTLSNTFGIQCKSYDLLPDHDWMIDLEHLRSLIDDNTVAIIVNNPSNPCGSNYTRQHLIDIINLAKAYHLPIIADEVYGDMVFAGNEFYYMSELSDTVPILSCNALSKRFIMPGWRFGWIALHDPKNYLKNVRQGIMDLTTRILGPNSLVQAMTVDILEKTPASYYERIMNIVKDNAETMYEALSKLPGIKPTKPSGAMYMMFAVDFSHFPEMKNDQEFVERMVKEQSVFCIPATCFGLQNYVRIVLTMKHESIMEACGRIAEFINKHYHA